mmetsp:Transcript_29490/g.93227  ORF Transcript_29490/g.93227 Transcript_29490/m.93227 type:complete len:413 (-) Transcript_29490:30-1268(-)
MPLREDQRVIEQLLDRRLVCEVVVAVGRVQLSVLLMLEHRRGERVEGEHVRHLLLAILAGLLDDVRVDDALSRHEPVRELRLGELRRQLVPPQIGVELGAAGGDVLLLEGSHALGDRLVGERVKLERAHHRHARGEAGEADFDELLGVERPVPVAAARDRPRQHHPGRVGRLEDAFLVDTAGDLSNEHRSEPLRAQLLVHAEEIHLDHRLVAHLGRAAAAARSRARCAAVQVESRQLLLHVDAARAGAALALLRLVSGRRRARLDPLAVAEEVGRGGADEGDQLLRLRHPHAHMPVVERAGRLHRPADKVERVVKAEHGVAILDVVFVQQRVELLGLLRVGQVEVRPLEGGRQVVRLRTHLLRVRRVDGAAGVVLLCIQRRHWLRVPEGVPDRLADLLHRTHALPMALCVRS